MKGDNMKHKRLPNIPYIVGAGILLALLLAVAYAGAQDEPEVANGWGCTYLPVIFGTLPDDTPNLPGEPAIIPVTGLAVCRGVNIGDPQQPTPESTATAEATPEATATVEPTATATIEPTATVGVTITVTPEATATPCIDDDDIGTMGGGHDDDCDDDDSIGAMDSGYGYEVVSFTSLVDGDAASVSYLLGNGNSVTVQFAPELLRARYGLAERFGWQEVVFGDIVFRMIREDRSWADGTVSGIYSDWDALYDDLVLAQVAALDEIGQ